MSRVELREHLDGRLALVCDDGSALLGRTWWVDPGDFESDASALMFGNVDPFMVEAASHIDEGFVTVATWSPEVGRDVDTDRCGAAALRYLGA